MKRRINQKWLFTLLTSWCYSSSEIFDIMATALECDHNGEIEEIIQPSDAENPAEVTGYHCALCDAELEDESDYEKTTGELPF